MSKFKINNLKYTSSLTLFIDRIMKHLNWATSDIYIKKNFLCLIVKLFIGKDNFILYLIYFFFFFGNLLAGYIFIPIVTTSISHSLLI